MPKKKEQPPLTPEERVQITREAIRLAIGDFLNQRKKEFDDVLLGWIKRVFWYIVGGVIIGLFHILMHGKYEKVADFLVNATR